MYMYTLQHFKRCNIIVIIINIVIVIINIFIITIIIFIITIPLILSVYLSMYVIQMFVLFNVYD